MIRVIKPGIKMEDRYFATCRNCSCEIEFSQKDGTVVRDWRDGDFIQVKCPTCGANITKAL